VHDVLVITDLLHALQALAISLIIDVVGRVDQPPEQIPFPHLRIEDVRHLDPPGVGQQGSGGDHERTVLHPLLDAATFTAQFCVVFGNRLGRWLIILNLGSFCRPAIRMVEIEGDLDGPDPVLELERLAA
jgi:hypothetical protein